jgi:glycosyltransferase involved in cell wall biosynthesis
MPTEHLRRQLGLEGRRILLFVGFITPRKGLEYLAQAMQLLPEDVHLLIVGIWGPGCRSRFMRALGQAANRVHEIGYIADELRPYYYSLADIYVSPSILEGLGITPIEALACQTPAVVTEATSGAEEVGESGVLVPPCDSEALAEAIKQLLGDQRQLTQMGRSGRDYVCRNFSYQRMTELTLQGYERFRQAKPFSHQSYKPGEVNVG